MSCKKCFVERGRREVPARILSVGRRRKISASFFSREGSPRTWASLSSSMSSVDPPGTHKDEHERSLKRKKRDTKTFSSSDPRGTQVREGVRERRESHRDLKPLRPVEHIHTKMSAREGLRLRRRRSAERRESKVGAIEVRRGMNKLSAKMISNIIK